MLKNARAIVMGSLLLILGMAILVREVFPLQLLDLSHRIKFWSYGVTEFNEGGIRGYLRDTCDRHDPEARGCQCVVLLHGIGDDPVTWQKLLIAPKTSWVKPVKLYAPILERNQRYQKGEDLSLYEVKNQAQAIAKTFAPLCSSWVVVGNSLGGWEAAWMALNGKLKIEKLILVNSVGVRDSFDPTSVDLFAHPTVEHVTELLNRVYFKPPQLSDRARKVASDLWTRADLASIIRAQKEEDLLDGKLRSLRLPTMILWGSADRLIPEVAGKQLNVEVPGSIWREIPECGHVPQKECPVPVIQAINDMIKMGAM